MKPTDTPVPDGAQYSEATCETEPPAAHRSNLEPDRIERGLLQLLFTLVELIRQLMEKQALRRLEAGGVDHEQIEELGVAIERLERKMMEIKHHFNTEDLNVDVGPLGNLLDGRK